jgi:hypothetical protein
MKKLILPAGILWALLCSTIVYFGFTTNYTIDTFSPGSFQKQYTHHVYRYRVLSQWLILGLDRALEGHMDENARDKRRILIRDSTATNRFYYAYYILNTFFLVLMAIVLALLLKLDRLLRASSGERMLLLFFLISLTCLTQFVVCPYDVCGYFLELATFYLFLCYYERNYRITMLLVAGLVILATINRESSALTVAFIATLLLCRFGWTSRAFFGTLLLGTVFLATYFGLRLFYGPDTLPEADSGPVMNFFHNNLTLPTDWLGILFWILMLYLAIAISNANRNRIAICCFHLLCLPYAWQCLTKGILWELRLYMPILLGSLIMSKIDMSAYRWPDGKWAFAERG